MNYEAIYSFAKDFIFPTIVAFVAAFASYKGAYKLSENALKEANNSKVVDLTNSLVIELNKLNNLLEKLKDDVSQYSYFLLQSTKIALNSAYRLRSLNDQVILFDDEDLRRQIIENTDLAISLVEEIDLMENILVNEQRKLDDKRSQAEKEYRDLRLGILSLDIFIDPVDNIVKFLNEKNTKQKKNKKPDNKILAIQSVMNGLIAEIDSSELDNLKKSYERKRNLLVVRVLDVQTKIRQLVNDLNDLKKNY